MAKLRNIGGPAIVGPRPGHPAARPVAADEVLEVPGEAKEIDDAYLVTAGDEVTAYPKSRWSLVAAKTASTAKKGE